MHRTSNRLNISNRLTNIPSSKTNNILRSHMPPLRNHNKQRHTSSHSRIISIKPHNHRQTIRNATKSVPYHHSHVTLNSNAVTRYPTSTHSHTIRSNPLLNSIQRSTTNNINKNQNPSINYRISRKSVLLITSHQSRQSPTHHSYASRYLITRQRGILRTTATPNGRSSISTISPLRVNRHHRRLNRHNRPLGNSFTRVRLSHQPTHTDVRRGIIRNNTNSTTSRTRTPKRRQRNSLTFNNRRPLYNRRHASPL